MKIGIDKIGFATPLCLEVKRLSGSACHRSRKLSKGLRLKNTALLPLTEDIITLGAAAADPILTSSIKRRLDMVIIVAEPH